ncbi:MAG: c-type cytochrome [Acidobacteriaceae bacterium]
MQSRKFFAAVLGAAVAAATPSMFSQQTPAPSTPGATSQPGATREHHWPKPTNLKVLPKDTSPEHLHEIMEGIAGSLGVHCSFCHVQNQQTHHMDFASDAKPDKGIARIMMQMTGTINEQYMTQVKDPDAMPEDKHVTCGTCHRGQKMPAHFVPPPEHHGPPPAGNLPKAPASQQR